MTVIEYRKVKCDNCGKEEVVKNDGWRPSHWLEISITEWSERVGEGRLNKEVCSEKCALELLKNLKEIPKKETYIY